jgi:hypothetical protein
MASLIGHVVAELEGLPETALGVHRTFRPPASQLVSRAGLLRRLASEQVVRHVFLKQIRDAERGELAALQQVVEASSRVTPETLRWRRLRGAYELSVSRLASHPLDAELGLPTHQVIKLAFAAEFGFRMEPGIVRWP